MVRMTTLVTSAEQRPVTKHRPAVTLWYPWNATKSLVSGCDDWNWITHDADRNPIALIS
jgi:hypothetical protein